MHETTVDLSIVIPVYNEEESLDELISQLTEVLNATRRTYELVFVDDGSRDRSLDILKNYADQRPDIVIVQQRNNFGKSAALMAGFHVAGGAVVITMDADLQDEPQEIPTLLAKLDEGYDVVTGQRENRWGNDPLSKTLPSRLANRITRVVSGVPLSDMNSGFKCYRADVTRNIHLHSDHHRYIPVLAYYEGFRVTETPVKHHPRKYGSSKYGAGRYLRSLLDLMTVMFLSRYSTRPLHLFGSIGLILLALGTMFGVYLSGIWLFTDQAIGDRPLLLLAVLLIVVGIQFLLFGLIADLVLSINRTQEDPLGKVRHIYRSREPEDEAL